MLLGLADGAADRADRATVSLETEASTITTSVPATFCNASNSGVFAASSMMASMMASASTASSSSSFNSSTEGGSNVSAISSGGMNITEQ